MPRPRASRPESTAVRPPVPRFALGAAALALGACAEGSGEVSTHLQPTAIYSPSDGQLPLPNDLLFTDSIDGTLAPPAADDPDAQAVVEALSALDGWSVANPVRLRFSEALDPASVALGDSVRMYAVAIDAFSALAGGPVTAVLRELGADELDVTLGSGGTEVAIWPTVPLAPGASYLALATRDLRSAAGVPIAPSIVYDLAASGDPVPPSDPLAPLQERLLAERDALEAFGAPHEGIVVSTSFTTQSIGAVHGALAAIARGQEDVFAADLCAHELTLDCSNDPSGPAPPAALAVLGPVDLPLPDGVPFFLADFFEGALTVPSFSTPAAAPSGDPSHLSEDDAPTTMRWRARFPFGPDDFDRHLTGRNPLPASTFAPTIPVLLARPLTPRPQDGWPVVVFQHGITGARTNALAIVNACGLAGFAVVAIDLPLHGVTDDEDPLFVGYADVPGQPRERTFGLDLLTEGRDGEEEPVSDGVADSSGAHFIQLASLLTTRDNLRQAASDLLHLFEQVGTVDFDGDGVADLDGERVFYVGHSLGAIVGGQVLPHTERVTAASLAMPGGGLARLLEGSPTFGPQVLDGLAEQGVLPGTEEYDTFLDVAQAAIDDGDPLAHAAALAAQGKPLHVIEVVGEEGFSEPDQVVPNAVEGAPLAGTEPLVAALGLAPITGTVVDLGGIRGVARFLRGDHVTVLIPSDFDDFELIAAWEEMQREVVDFAYNEGKLLTVLDPDLLQQD